MDAVFDVQDKLIQLADQCGLNRFKGFGCSGVILAQEFFELLGVGLKFGRCHFQSGSHRCFVGERAAER